MAKHTKLVSAAIAAALLTGVVAPAQAVMLVKPSGDAAVTDNTKDKNTGQSDTTKITSLKDRADREIARRIEALNTRSARIEKMKKITEAQETTLQTTVQSQVKALTDLKAKIANSTNLETVKTDVQSITKSYRTFALVIPQSAIIAAGDRALVIAGRMETLGNKLEARIGDAKKTGKDVASLEKSLADYKAKIKDAKTQAQAAIDAVSKLTPDGGDKTKMEANLQAMKDAKAKIQAAQQDFVTARKDAKDIVQGLRALGKVEKKTQTTTGDTAGNSPTSTELMD